MSSVRERAMTKNRVKLLDDVTAPEETTFFILEDSLMYQKKMVAAIREIGFKGKITITASVAEAAKKIDEGVPGFILSDWNLPDGKGIDFLKIVRAKSELNGVPFIMVTTMDSIDNILDAVKAGADGYLVKLWEKEDLLEKISFAFEKRTGISL